MQNVNFTGRTNIFRSDKLIKYAETTKSTPMYAYINPKYENNKLTKSKMYSLPCSKDSFTVIVKNEDDGFAMTVPIIGNITKQLKKLAEKTSELKQKAHENLTAWIIGGSPYNIDKGNSMNTLNKLAEVIADKPDIDTSILCGIKNQEHLFLMHNTKNSTELILHGKNHESLEDMFDYVETSNVNFVNNTHKSEELIKK